jgi:hypothetical protein
MSLENVKLVRAIFEDFIAGKSEFDTEGMLTRMAGEELWDPDIQWDASESAVPDIGGVYRGVEDVRGFWREWLGAWETVEFEYELVDAGSRCSTSGCAGVPRASRCPSGSTRRSSRSETG